MTKAGERLIRSAKQAVDIARGNAKPAGLFVPSEIDVKAIRVKVDASQEDFASMYGFSLDQIKNWEQNRSRPLGGNRAYLMLIDKEPEVVCKLVKEVRKQEMQSRAERDEVEELQAL